MVITPHTITATLIAVNLERLWVKNPTRYPRKIIWPAVGLAGFCSHFLLDFMPHSDYSIHGPNQIENFIKLSYDTAVALTLIGHIVWGRVKSLTMWSKLPIGIRGLTPVKEKTREFPFLITVSVCAISALVPDILIVLSKSFGGLHVCRVFHEYFHSSYEPGLVLGSFTQGLIVVIEYLLTRRAYQKLTEEETYKKKFYENINEIDMMFKQ